MFLQALTPSDRSKFARIIAQLDAAEVGVKTAAALAATRFLETRHLRWVDLAAEFASMKDRPKAQDPGEELDESERRRIVQECLARRQLLSALEVNFLENLPNFSQPSAKQIKWLIDIYKRVRRA